MIEEIEKPKVYKTMIEPHPDSIPNLTGWQRPQHAYVLIEIPQINILSEGRRVAGKGLYTLNAESRAEVQHMVDRSLNEGGRILDYGNFPKTDDPNAARREKARHYSKGGENPWDLLENFVKMKMAKDRNWESEKKNLVNENDALRAKLAELEARKAREEVAVEPEKAPKVKATKEEK